MKGIREVLRSVRRRPPSHRAFAVCSSLVVLGLCGWTAYSLSPGDPEVRWPLLTSVRNSLSENKPKYQGSGLKDSRENRGIYRDPLVRIVLPAGKRKAWTFNYGWRQDEEGREARRISVEGKDAWYFALEEPDFNCSPVRSLISFALENDGVSREFSVGKLVGLEFEFTEIGYFDHRIALIQAGSSQYVFHSVAEVSGRREGIPIRDIFQLIAEPTLVDISESKRFVDMVEKTELDSDGKLNERGSSGDVKEPKLLSAQSPTSRKCEGEPGTGYALDRAYRESERSSKTEPGLAPEMDETSLRVLSKPKPQNTELSEIYRLEGFVQLWVTFGAEGQILDVIPAKRLPFGLTENAVTTARKMRFLPASKSGVPHDVKKLVRYNFTVY